MQVVAKLLGREELPWEGDLAEKNPTARHRLGLFREPILSLLHRDPAQRISLADFCKTTNNVFSSPSTVEIQRPGGSLGTAEHVRQHAQL